MSDTPHPIIINEAIVNELAASDFTQLVDSPFTSEVRQAWRLYRQALRDLSKQPTVEAMIETWPSSPSGKNVADVMGWR